MYYVFSFVIMCQNKMQVDQEDQKLQAGDSGDKKAEAEEMEVTLCWAIITVMSMKFWYYTQQHYTAVLQALCKWLPKKLVKVEKQVHLFTV